jgi:probable HAF family extracellular repeat protein
MVGLGILPGFAYSGASGVSADGSVVVGESSGIKAFRWTAGTGMVGLGDIPGGGNEVFATGVSADGSVIVGSGNFPGSNSPGATNHKEAYRWTSGTGFVALGDLTGGDWISVADAVSADGNVVVGTSDGGSGPEAFRWTSDTGMVGLGDIAGGRFDSRAIAVSADGSVVVGSGISTSGRQAVLWTSAGGMVGLGYLPGSTFESRSVAHGVSADGSVVVGQNRADSLEEAFVWTQGEGMQSLRDVLIANGVTGFDDWVLYNANDISANGQWVVGNGMNPSGFEEAFLANISAP